MPKALISAVIIILLILGVIFFLWPKYEDFSATRLNLKTKNTELQDKENYFSNLNTLSSRLKEYGSQLAKIDSALPASPGTIDLLNFIEKTSSQSGLILEKISLGGTSTVENNPKIIQNSVDATLLGSYPAFKNFLTVLQQSARLIEVEGISLSGAEKNKDNFSFDIKIKTHSY